MAALRGKGTGTGQVDLKSLLQNPKVLAILQNQQSATTPAPSLPDLDELMKGMEWVHVKWILLKIQFCFKICERANKQSQLFLKS